MDYRIIWTEKASEDIEAVVRYIARHNRKAAAEIGQGIFDRVQVLLKQQESGTILEELDDPTIRKIIFKNWKIVYQHSANEQLIIILRVWHAARGEVEI